MENAFCNQLQKGENQTMKCLVVMSGIFTCVRFVQTITFVICMKAIIYFQ